MIFKHFFYLLVLLMLISCGTDVKHSPPPSNNHINPEIISEVTTNDLDDSDIGISNTITDVNIDVVDNDIDDSDVGRSNSIDDEDTDVVNNDIDDTDTGI